MAVMERARDADRDLRVVDHHDRPETVAAALAEVPDVVVVAIEPGPVHTLRVCREVADRAPVTRVIVVASAEHAAHAYQALRIGAFGAIDPGAGPAELHAAAEAVAAGEAVLAPRHAGWVLRELEATGQPAPGTAPRPEQLTITERTILRLLAEGTRPQAVADHLGVSTRVVGRHVGSALARLHRHYRRPAAGTGGRSPAVSRRDGDRRSPSTPAAG